MVLLCGEDDDKLQNAAAGALAMLTGAHKKLCFKMTEVVRAGPGAQPRPTALHDPLRGRPAPWVSVPTNARGNAHAATSTLLMWTP